MGDHIDQSPPDVELLGELSKVCAKAHSPFIAAALADRDGYGLVAGAVEPA